MPIQHRLEDIRNFTWHVFCDFYVEAVKDRLYRPEVYGKANAAAAQHTLYEVLYRMLQLLAPVTPHMTEEIYQYMYKDGKGYQSIQVSQWPKYNPALVDEAAEKDGDLITAIMSEIRRDKAEKKMSLNAPIKNLTIYANRRRHRRRNTPRMHRHRRHTQNRKHQSHSGKSGRQTSRPIHGLHKTRILR